MASSLRWNEEAFITVMDSYLSSYTDTRTPPLYINVPEVNGPLGNYTYTQSVKLSSLRDVEKEIIVVEDLESYDNIAVFDLRENT